jgi:hypothetical protein
VRILIHHEAPRIEDEHTTLDGLGPKIIRIALPLGLVFLALSFWLGNGQGDGLRRFGFSYLLNFAYYLSLSLGALFFVAVNHLSRASWSVVIRRLAEILAVNLVLLAILALPILVNLTNIYAWAAGEAHGHDELLAHKQSFLNPAFFTLRWAVYFAIWCIYAIYYWRRSLQQDRTGDPQLTINMETRSGPALALFAVTVTLAAFDLLMSLDFTWFSTIFGVYFFAGGVVGFYALLTLITLGLQRTGRLARIVSIEHYHDYGKLMFAFVFFWAYIAFSQYMLIWYANIPEETAWLLKRQTNGWGAIGLVLIFGHWLIPFAGLMSRFTKRKRALLGFWAVWIIVMHWFDMFWIVMPELGLDHVPFHVLDVTCFLGIGGVYLAGLAYLAGNRPLVPLKDPRLKDSIRFENA